MMTTELPHDIAAERSVIGSVLIDRDCFAELGDRLEPQDFYKESHQEIWSAFRTLSRQGTRIDMIVLGEQLKKQNALHWREASSEIVECVEDTITAASVKQYIKIVKDKSLLRQLIRLGKEITYLASVDEAEADGVIQNTEKNLLKIADRIKGDRPTTASGIIKEISDDMQKVKEEGWTGLDTGFAQLDENTGGLIKGMTWVFGAYTGVGKTWFLLQIILNVLQQGGKIILFSTEMDRKMVMLRLIGNIAALGSIRMMKNQLMDDEYVRMEKAKEVLQSYKDQLIIYDNIKTVDDIRLKIKKQLVSGGCDIVFVDYIQNVKSSGKDLYARMADAATELYNMGGELGVTMFLASQVSQNSAGASSKESIDFKGAGEIAAVADVALWASKNKNDKFTRTIMMRKVRHGEIGQMIVKIQFPSGRITALDGSEDARDTEEVKKQLESLPD